MSSPNPKSKAKWRQIAVFIPLVPLFVIPLFLWLVFFVLSTVCLHAVIWSWWCLRGRDVLFVFSDSPVWHDYIERRILPVLGERAVAINWSHRKQWRPSLARMAFYHFGGWHAFNPMAVVFRPFRRTRTFRFLKPFRDFKHGRPEALQKMEREFFCFIGVPGYSENP